MKPRWDSQVWDHTRPCLDGIVSSAETGAGVGEEIAEGDLVGAVKAATGDEGPGGPDLNAEKMREAKAKGAVESADASMGWGRAGQTETTRERNAEEIPESALQSMGIEPSMTSGSISPTPNEFGRPVRPDPDCSEGLWNAGAIFNNTKIG